MAMLRLQTSNDIASEREVVCSGNGMLLRYFGVKVLECYVADRLLGGNEVFFADVTFSRDSEKTPLERPYIALGLTPDRIVFLELSASLDAASFDYLLNHVSPGKSVDIFFEVPPPTLEAGYNGRVVVSLDHFPPSGDLPPHLIGKAFLPLPLSASCASIRIRGI